jgi:AcrR family transcriptional regulator
MVQNTTPTAKRRGRPPAFDREAVVAAAIIAFWTKGFEATTLTDLEAATGVDRSSIYNSFGGKEGLYLSATAAYVDSAEDVLFEPLYKGTAGIADIVEFLDRLAKNLGAGSNPDGCLIVNDMAATVDRRATDRYLTRLEDGLRAALERASQAGETDPNMNARRCQILTAAILGINITHRNDDTRTRAPNLINALRSEVNSWTVPNRFDTVRARATESQPTPEAAQNRG